MAIGISSSKTAAAINVTPMIDILLVLLITFMVLQIRSEGLPSEVPEPAPDDHRLARRLDATLRIGNDRSIQIDSQPVSLADLDGRLRTLRAPDSVLFIDAGRELDYEDVASVIDIARGAGWKRIGLLPEHSGP